MKNKKILIIFILVLLALPLSFFANSFNGVSSVEAVETDSGYVIENYDVKIDVFENNNYFITETIEVNFLEARHGIVRDIPVLYKIRRADKSSSKQRSKISKMDIKMDGEKVKVKESFNSGTASYKIGNSKNLITGNHVYTISYNYNFGKDKLKGADEFYFNIIGTNWSTKINNVTFSINMPKDFSYDLNTLGFSYGKYGEAKTEGVNYAVDGKTISGNMTAQLDAFEGLTIRLSLEDGYFVGATNNFYNKFVKTSIIVGIVSLIIALCIVLFVKFNTHIATPVSFYPPRKKSPLKIARDYKIYVGKKDVVSVIINMANKGYLKIIETKDKDFKFSMVKPYSGNDLDEQDVYFKLFNDGTRKTVTLKELQTSNFASTAKIITDRYNNSREKAKIVSKKTNLIKMLLGALVLINVIFTLLMCSEKEVRGISIGFAVIWAFIALIVYLTFKMSKTKSNLFLIGCWVLLYLIVYAVCFSYYSIDFLLALACLGLSNIGISFLVNFVIIRTSEGEKAYGEALGFREFLLRAEKDRLEKLVEENPNYYYDILPYVYVLGISKAWVKKFEGIVIEKAEWYDGPYYTLSGLYISIHKFSTKMSSNYSSSSSSSSGWSSGGMGGGFSGGGGGGGGGSSW